MSNGMAGFGPDDNDRREWDNEQERYEFSAYSAISSIEELARVQGQPEESIKPVIVRLKALLNVE